MTVLKINDNSKKHQDEFDTIPQLTKKILDKTLLELESENIFIFPEFVKETVDIEASQKILFKNKDQYYTTNIMGFIGYDRERLVISSRFSSDTDDYFMQYLLSRVLDIPNIVDLHSDANSDNKLFNILMFLFPLYLKRALRKGLYKTYVRSNSNDANLKGAIDVSRHIKLNTPFIGKIAYTQRELSYDNALLQLVRHTIEYIKQKSFGANILSKASDEVKQIVEVTTSYTYQQRRKVLDVNKKHLIAHAYFHEYRTLQRLCIMILHNEKIHMDASSQQVYGILFDGAWLWEEYVNTLISDKFYHPMNKGSKGAQQLFSLENSKAGLIYPDFISRDEQNRVIADAKYKPIDNIRSADYLQVLAYMFRFDAKCGLYLYPDHDNSILKTYYLNAGSTYENNVSVRDDISLKKMGLKIPQVAVDYDDFTVQMQMNELTFLREVLIIK